MCYVSRSVGLAGGLCCGALLSVCVITSALGQGPPSHIARPAPFARYVPASAKLFVRSRRLAEVDEALHRAHAWRLLPLLSGTPTDAPPFDLRTAVMRFLGPDSTISVDQLMRAEMGIAASSWSQLGGAVWYARIQDEADLDRWFPGRRSNRGGNPRKAYSFRTDDGIRVCVHGSVIAMARREGGISLLRETMALMRGRSGDALQANSQYRSLLKQLPPRPLAVVYMAGADTEKAGKSHSSRLWPAIDRAVVGLYEGDGRIELAIRARLLTPHRKGRISRSATNRLMRLPQTTLFAAAFTVDFAQTVARAAADPTSGSMGRYLTLFEALRGASGIDRQPTTTLGEQVIVAWGQDLSQGGSTPQLALLLECVDARALRDEVNTVARNLVNLLKTFDSGARTHPPTIQHSTHLGTAVTHVPLRSYAQRSEVPLVRLMGNLEPAWATIGNWFVFALSRDHLERILDAQIGLSPQLAGVRDLRALSRRDENLMVLAAMRAGLATDVLDRWLRAFDQGQPSLLDKAWWLPLGDSEAATQRSSLAAQRSSLAGQGSSSAGQGSSLSGQGSSSAAQRSSLAGRRSSVDTTRHFGIAIKANAEDGQDTRDRPGAIEVARVLADTPAAGRLQVGDRIIGIDGALLDLSRPGADFHRRLAKSTAATGPTIRVQRGTTTLDVLLPLYPNRDPKQTARPKGNRKEGSTQNTSVEHRPSLPEEGQAHAPYPAIHPADAVRELASLWRTLQFAIFTVQASKNDLYSARLTLRFPPAKTPKSE